MNKIKKNIPNLITISNLVCGLLAIIFAFQGSFTTSSIFVFLGALFDFSDGLIARILKVNNEIGKQLDSLCDLITFGAAPGFILFNFMFYLENQILLRYAVQKDYLFFPSSIALLIPIFSAYRLAKFNVTDKQSTDFIGLPTPALAIFIASIPHINFNLFPMFTDIKLISLIAIIMPFLLVIKAPFMSLKFKKKDGLNSKVNLLRISLILISTIFLFVFGLTAIPFIVILYLILSLINNTIKI